MKKLVLIVVLFYSTKQLFAQFGPAGVGSSVTNKLWLRGDAGTSSSVNLAKINKWRDQSNNGFNFNQTVVSPQPLFISSGLNGKPVIRFDGIDDKLILNDFISTNDQSIFLVSTNFAAAQNSSATILDIDQQTLPRANWSIEQNGAVNDFRFLYTDNAFNDNASNNFLLTGNNITSIIKEGIAVTVGKNGINTSNVTSNSVINKQNRPFALGGTVINDARNFGGDIAEVIIYSIAVNSAQKIIIENYLASKYAMVLGANDKYAFDAVHGNQVAGIGRENPTSLQLDSKGGFNLVRVNNPSNLDDGEYLMFGNDNASLSILEFAEVPPGINNRLKRVWRFDQNGDVGTVSISFYLSTFTINSETQLELLIDNDGNFVNASRISSNRSYDPATQVVTFNNVTVADGDYITVASNDENTVLPVELISLTGKSTGVSALLNWSTAKEVNNNYFALERSENGIDGFKEIGIFKGEKASYQIKNYSHEDKDAKEGTFYYRLIQVDGNGFKRISKVVAVLVDGKNPEILVIYPNPVTNSALKLVSIPFDDRETVVVELLDLNGKLVYTKTITGINADTEILNTTETSGLAKNLYYLKFTGKSTVYHTGFVVQ